MARVADEGVAQIYDLHRTWIRQVLGAGDSLFTPGEAVWTIEHLDELERDFIGQPDTTKDKRFLEKLHDQLAHVSPEAVQLMAELHAVHFMIISNAAISAAKKRSDLDAILSWMPKPVAVDPKVSAAMAPGIAHPGQWVMTRRDTQLTWLIRFARAWKDLPSERQETLTEHDAWGLKSFAEGIQAPSGDGARLALLHLAYPDTFEPIVSPAHKRLIVERFVRPVSAEQDVDRLLLEARTVATDDYGDGFDWYGDPLVNLWWKNPKQWPKFLDWVQRLRALPDFDEQERDYKLHLADRVAEARSLLLAGEAGWADTLTGAFHDSSNNLTQWQVADRFLKWVNDDNQSATAALLTLWHPGSDAIDRLTAFLDAVPLSALGPVGERVNIATFLLMPEDPATLPPMKITSFRNAWKLAGWARDPGAIHPAQVYRRALLFLDEVRRDSSTQVVPLRDRLDAQGAVWSVASLKERPSAWSEGTWQEFLAFRNAGPLEKEDPYEPESVPSNEPEIAEAGPLTDHIAIAAAELNVDRAVLDEIVDLLDDKGQVILYGPPGTGKTYLALRLARAITAGDEGRISIVQFHPATSYEDFFEGLRPRLTEAGQVTYERSDGPLVAIADRARVDRDHTYLLVIDEINRANLPKVFGELLFLLEYRKETVRTLYRPDRPFSLPGNLQIIATMNTADRSIALIDAAMRRRFHFVPFFPHQGPMKDLLRNWLSSHNGNLGIALFLDAVNGELLDKVGEHLLVGPSHFMKVDLSERSLMRIWTYNVFPLIEEQFWGSRDEIDRWRWDAVRHRYAELLGLKTAVVAAEEPESTDS